MIEIKDLDECVTKEEVTMALDALLGVPVSNADPVKSPAEGIRQATQVAVVATTGRTGGRSAEARPRADRLGELSHPCSRGGCALLPLLEPWPHGRSLQGSRPHGSLPPMRPEGPSSKGLRRPTFLELPSGPEDHPGPPMMRNPPAQPQPLARLAQDLHCDAISKLRIDVAILCEQYKNLAPPKHMARRCPTAKQLSGCMEEFRCRSAPARSTSYFAWARIERNFLFSAVLRSTKTLWRGEFSALLANITEEGPRQKAPCYCRGLQTHGRRSGDVGRTRTAGVHPARLARSPRCGAAQHRRCANFQRQAGQLDRRPDVCLRDSCATRKIMDGERVVHAQRPSGRPH
ncbi:unnamed protein product [Trichogramma brassicae]|uniref:Uncharacterized protein n=1 Tax=Trichogramma brassicae TaxID=86971 RepID=A0A6H5IG19_9HYME|nr:unnamed protein product [Trichogramma brassicae]